MLEKQENKKAVFVCKRSDTFHIHFKIHHFHQTLHFICRSIYDDRWRNVQEDQHSGEFRAGQNSLKHLILYS